MLLSLSVNSVESIQAFIFYLMQYSVSNLNAFILLLTIGYSFYCFTNNDKDFINLQDKNNSPIQLISQTKGYFYINPIISISLAISLFSFAGIPPLIGFFAKQMVFSAALDKGYVFMVLLAILTSVISAVYYLGIVKQIFFDKPDSQVNPSLDNTELTGTILNESEEQAYSYQPGEIKLSSSLTVTISVLTNIILFFFFAPSEWLRLANILALIMLNP